MTSCETVQVRVYIAGPIEPAKQIIRREVMRDPICVTIEPTLYIYTGGEEDGYVVGFINYPRFPSSEEKLVERARDLLKKLLLETYQKGALLVAPSGTQRYTIEDDFGLENPYRAGSQAQPVHPETLVGEALG